MSKLFSKLFSSSVLLLLSLSLSLSLQALLLVFVAFFKHFAFIQRIELILFLSIFFCCCLNAFLFAFFLFSSLFVLIWYLRLINFYLLIIDRRCWYNWKSIAISIYFLFCVALFSQCYLKKTKTNNKWICLDILNSRCF